MSMKFGVMVPQGWRMDLVDFPDPVEAYEAMTRVAQEAEHLGFHLLVGGGGEKVTLKLVAQYGVYELVVGVKQPSETDPPRTGRRCR